VIKINTVKLIVNKSTSPSAVNMLKVLGIEVIDYKLSSKEAYTLNKIMTVFKNEKMHTQYPVGKYRINLYF
jgi:hypothetical protein